MNVPGVADATYDVCATRCRVLAHKFQALSVALQGTQRADRDSLACVWPCKPDSSQGPTVPLCRTGPSSHDNQLVAISSS